VRVTYDHKADAAYIYLTDEPLTPGRDSVPIDPPEGIHAMVALDWKDGRIVGLEVLDAAVLPGTAGGVWLKRGLLGSKKRCPPRRQTGTSMGRGGVMGRVVIGTDPHKRSATIEVRDEREILLATGRFGMDKTGYRQLLRYVRQWPERAWAWKAPTGSAGRWPRGCWPTARRCGMCRRSWPPGCGCSTPDTVARPMPPTPTR
jgi:uncharacterized protein YuzE